MGAIEVAPMEPVRRPALVINPRSGGGKAGRHNLPAECEARGIETVVLRRGDDLLRVVESLVEHGADALGMAGGDGSQALAATVAHRHDLPYVCVPAGTRNHFALDVGVDRTDVVGALDAFAHGTERRVDLATVNGRVFVNNASLGVYAKIVRSDAYRDNQLETVARMLPDLLPPRGAPFDLAFDAPDGERWEAPQLVLVSNNPYRLPQPGSPGARGGVDGGELGVIAVRVVNPAELLSLLATESTGEVPRRPGWLDFTKRTFVVDAKGPVELALDGEPCVLEPPLRFETLPASLRLRSLARTRPGIGSRLRRRPSGSTLPS